MFSWLKDKDEMLTGVLLAPQAPAECIHGNTGALGMLGLPDRPYTHTYKMMREEEEERKKGRSQGGEEAERERERGVFAELNLSRWRFEMIYLKSV